MMSMVLLILIPILFGVMLYLVPLRVGKVIVLLVQLFLSFLSLSLLLRNMAEGTFFEVLGGADPILYVPLRGDRFSLIFVCLSVFLFSMAFFYAVRVEEYFNKRFLLLFLVLQGLLNGLFLTDDLFNLFVLIEVSTVVITVLVMFKREGRNAFDGLFYLTMQIVTMMFFLFGVGYVYRIFGVLNFTAINEMIVEGIPKETLIMPFSFMITGIALKIGYFPLFSWVSHAYGNPSVPFPVLAMVSGIFVKSGLFFLIRMHDIFSPVLDYSHFFVWLGLITGLAGAVKAISQKDIKLILGFHTISQLGLITAGIFLPGNTSTIGGMYHIVNHAMFKSLLFLTAGIIAKEYKTTHVNEIRGLFQRMPWVAAATTLGLLGITGFPFVNGSVSKYWIMYGSSRPMEIALWVLSMGTIISFVKYAAMLFRKSPVRVKTEPMKTTVVLVMGIVCVILGVFGLPIASVLFDVELSLTPQALLQKGIVYVVMVFCATIFYRQVIAKTNFLYRVAKSPTTVQQSCFILVAFFVSMVMYGIMLA